MTIVHMVINMSEQEPQDTNEWEAFADKKYGGFFMELGADSSGQGMAQR